MPFKPKPTKKIDDVVVQMLDTKHREYVERFETESSVVIPKLLEEASMETNPSKVAQIHENIEQLRKLQLNYYLDNSKHIFAYFEDKKSISENKTKTKVLNNFFNIDRSGDASHKMNRHAVQYLRNVDDAFLPSDQFVYQTSICTKCERGELIHVDYEGMLICNNPSCACQFRVLIENERPSYKDPPKEICFYAYKRINHFREILAQFQAKETTQIPSDILENIQLQIKKERIQLDSITNKKTKEILKKFGYNKYYEHIPFIKDKLGIKPPTMSPELEEKLCNLFIEIQRPYAKFCPDARVNFLNYYYTIYKLCELLEEDHFLPFFPMLKDREKRIEQDEIWKNICNELNWQFIPTI
jgi:hypothetical protein